MLRNFIFRNARNETLIIDGIYIRSVNGLNLGMLDVEITSTETNYDGSYFQSQRFGNRAISMEFQLRRKGDGESTMDLRKSEIYRILSPAKNPIRLEFRNDLNKQYYIEFYMTSIPMMAPDKRNFNNAFQRLLIDGICLDPFVYDKQSETIDLRETTPIWEFEWEIEENNTKFGEISTTSSRVIYNGGSADVGFLVDARVVSPGVTGITLLNQTTGKSMEISSGVTFAVNDRIRFSTEKGKKYVLKNSNNDITGYMNVNSSFFQLVPGDNLIKLLTIGSTPNGLNGDITFRPKYSGV